MSKGELGSDIIVIIPSVANNHLLGVSDVLFDTRVLRLREPLLIILVGESDGQFTRGVLSAKDHVDETSSVSLTRHTRVDDSIDLVGEIKD